MYITSEGRKKDIFGPCFVVYQVFVKRKVLKGNGEILKLKFTTISKFPKNPRQSPCFRFDELTIYEIGFSALTTIMKRSSSYYQMKKCNTKGIIKYVKRQQRNYLVHIAKQQKQQYN